MIRYFAGTLSCDEKATLFGQLEQDGAARAEFVRLQNVVALTGMAGHAEDARGVQTHFRALMHRVRVRRLRRISLSVARYAAMLVLLAGVWFFSRERPHDGASGYTLIEAPRGQRVYVTLADGTEVWLSSRTQLRVPAGFNLKERTVELDGEGLFTVSRDGGKPFVVQTRQYGVEVTGTHFNVFAYAESPLFEVDLLEGAVFVSDPADGSRLPLAPREKAYARSGMLHTTASSFAHSHYIKNGIYNFDDRSMTEIVARLELWYGVRIEIVRPEMADYRFSGKFRQTDDVGQILKAMKETGKFDYRILNDGRIEIY